MRKIFFSAVLFFLAACTGSKPVLYDCVQKNWHYVSARDEHGNDFKKVSATDILSLTDDKGKNNFKYDIELENIHASGTWELQDSTLVFTYNPKPTDADSSKRTVRLFRITECSGNRLVFIEKGITFTFSEGNP